jgi:hypothetical protein
MGGRGARQEGGRASGRNFSQPARRCNGPGCGVMSRVAQNAEETGCGLLSQWRGGRASEGVVQLPMAPRAIARTALATFLLWTSAAGHADAPSAICHDTLALQTARGQGAVHRFSVPLAHARIGYVDLGYRTPLVDALGEHQLVINGGYWAYAGEQRVIQGLLQVNGQAIAPTAGKSGGVFEVRDGHARMLPSASYRSRAGTQLAIQCSPRLVVAGKVVRALDGRMRAARTALCVAKDSALLRIYLTAEGVRPTLQELASFLRAEECVDALNLDGGPSTAAVLAGVDGPLRIGHGQALPYGLGFRIAE